MKNPSNDKVIEVSRSCNSASEACRILGLPWRKYRKLALMLGCYYPNQGQKGIPASKRTYSFTVEDLNVGRVTKISNYQLKSFLFFNNLKEHRCEICGIGEVWNGMPLVLQVHHIDGNNTNNRLSNIQILCPNCHSQTENFGRRNCFKYAEGESRRSRVGNKSIPKKKITHPISFCIDCGKRLNRWTSKRCRPCEVKFRYKEKKPSREELSKIFSNKGETNISISEIARRYNVSSTTIYRWARNYGFDI